MPAIVLLVEVTTSTVPVVLLVIAVLMIPPESFKVPAPVWLTEPPLIVALFSNSSVLALSEIVPPVFVYVPPLRIKVPPLVASIVPVFVAPLLICKVRALL